MSLWYKNHVELPSFFAECPPVVKEVVKFRLSATVGLIPAIATVQVMGHAYVTHATCVDN
jgi:hypothetical protein